ncbi:MAG: helix-turn-helix transcriptional regulator [Treponema sp.]|jgi:transcriptional regulator with XRE-family HTH domain|nr:helix-turn-helix transcriptional regulator [Treponema sp.]
MLAERAGTSITNIGMIETAKRYPSPQMLAKIAEALGLDTPELFTAHTVTFMPGYSKSIERLYQEIAGDFKQFEKTVISRIKVIQQPSPAFYPSSTDGALYAADSGK